MARGRFDGSRLRGEERGEGLGLREEEGVAGERDIEGDRGEKGVRRGVTGVAGGSQDTGTRKKKMLLNKNRLV